MENASRQYTFDRVKQMVEKQKDRYGWEFMFLGANMDLINVSGVIKFYSTLQVAFSRAFAISFAELSIP